MEAKQNLKVVIYVTLNVDPVAWAKTFGTCKSSKANDVRADVKEYFSVGAEEQLRQIGCEGTR